MLGIVRKKEIFPSFFRYIKYKKGFALLCHFVITPFTKVFLKLEDSCKTRYSSKCLKFYETSLTSSYSSNLGDWLNKRLYEAKFKRLLDELHLFLYFPRKWAREDTSFHSFIPLHRRNLFGSAPPLPSRKLLEEWANKFKMRKDAGMKWENMHISEAHL